MLRARLQSAPTDNSEHAPTANKDSQDGTSHLPPKLLSLVRPIVGAEPGAEVVFYNGGESPLTFAWQLQDAIWSDLTLEARESRVLRV